MTLVYAKKNATTKKGSRNVMGAELCLAHDMGGGGIGGPLLVDMWPYGFSLVMAVNNSVPILLFDIICIKKLKKLFHRHLKTSTHILHR